MSRGSRGVLSSYRGRHGALPTKMSHQECCSSAQVLVVLVDSVTVPLSSPQQYPFDVHLGRTPFGQGPSYNILEKCSALYLSGTRAPQLRGGNMVIFARL